MKNIFLTFGMWMTVSMVSAQTFTSYTTTESETWKTGKLPLKSSPVGKTVLEVNGEEQGVT
ncbi:MAG: hypothetical protein J6C92_07625, partial [Bacteroidaceae bacterium]|nr:hypothetical protein [Bacteroidaceae bacterium]